jgi:heme-degrading monooxygenase HmoA
MQSLFTYNLKGSMMNKPEYVLDVAVYTVKEEFVAQLPSIKDGLRQTLKSFSGFLGLESLSPMDEGRVFVDLAKWDCMESVKVVADAFQSGDERFVPLMEAVEELNFMGYFKP